MTRAEFARYVSVAGENAQRPARNTRYYLSYWERAATHAWFVSWNWATFWLTGFWMLYRKMYAWGALVLLAEFWLSLKAQPYMRLAASLDPAILENGQPPEILVGAVSMILLFGGISLGFRLLLSLFGNALYYHYAAHQLKIRSRAKGGVHLGVPLLWCAGLFLYNAWMMQALPPTAPEVVSKVHTQEGEVAQGGELEEIPKGEEMPTPRMGGFEGAALPKVDTSRGGRGASPGRTYARPAPNKISPDVDIPGAKKFFGW